MLFTNYDNYFSSLVVEEHLHPACRGILDLKSPKFTSRFHIYNSMHRLYLSVLGNKYVKQKGDNL